MVGVNKFEDKVWDELSKSKDWAKPIKGLIADKVLVVIDHRKKVTIDLVNKTYNVDLLNEWLVGAKGPLKGAISKQLDALDLEKDL